MIDLKIGTVSCLHGNLDNARKITDKFRENGIEYVFLIGDVASDEDQEENLTDIIDIFSALEAELYVSPGSHEHLEDYRNALGRFEGNDRVIDCSEVSSQSIEGYNFIFLPGSSVSAPGAGFKLLRDRRSRDRFFNYIEGYKEHFWGEMVPVYAVDIRKHAGQDSILISHDPPAFEGEDAIDFTEFGVPIETFKIKEEDSDLVDTTEEKLIRKDSSIFPIWEARELKEAGYPIEIRKRNVGTGYLRDLVDSIGISKYICGHIHESGGKAVRLDGDIIEQNNWSDDLFYNCSPGKEGRAGIVEFKGNNVRFKNIEV